eukprot:CAMPEP_0169417532 /NCGR_PEP_ID=MMETSP1017-20121227/63775_1 /TAXON_ID=342587 /ORGANISM="Karlodinium micrum, Strain CCMP2283" /LENGTH=100 /DNA_ID=CAMNT_0009525691 /DNA_START=198 /DNA_END=497 /DNA_ORIENTATION=+
MRGSMGDEAWVRFCVDNAGRFLAELRMKDIGSRIDLPPSSRASRITWASRKSSFDRTANARLQSSGTSSTPHQFSLLMRLFKRATTHASQILGKNKRKRT